MSILVLGEDHPYCSRLARAAEAQHLSISLYWSLDSLWMACAPEFDAAIVEARLWPIARAALARWRRLGVVLLLGSVPGSSGALTAGDCEILSLPLGTPPDQVLAALGEAAQRFAASRTPEEPATVADDPVAAPLELAGG